MTPAEEDALVSDAMNARGGTYEALSVAIRLAIRAAVAHERERAAKVCEKNSEEAIAQQSGPTDDLTNIMLRHHASQAWSCAAAKEALRYIVALMDEARPGMDQGAPAEATARKFVEAFKEAQEARQAAEDQLELAAAERSSASEAAAILFGYLGWKSGGLGSAAIETVQRAQRAEALAKEAIAIAILLFDAWEDGTPCFETDGESGMGASIGNAFKLSDDDFTRCVEFLNRVDPRGTAIDAARDGK